MNRRGDSRFTARSVLIAAALAAALALLPASAGAAPADDEYTLELPGVRNNPLSKPAPGTEPSSGGSADQAGVAGEASGGESPLDALASTVTSSPGAIALAVLAMMALAIPAGLRLGRPRTG